MSNFSQRLRKIVHIKFRHMSSNSSNHKNSDQVILETPSGKLRGNIQRSCLDDEYYAFKGIPYAKPPIGQLRFRDPQAKEAWTGIRDATSHSAISFQYEFSDKKTIGSEDCLYLNVYTRSLDTNSRLPVMFWIHGGAFIQGNGNDDLFGPDYLLAKNVVLVTVNYRLGIFGFLNLKHELALGNQGLKDQLMALKWVKNHIESFGGDPDNVTVFGQSAGAVSIQYLNMSPLSKGLFKRAICHSGTITSSWAFRSDPKDILQNSLDSLGINDRHNILEILRDIDARKLMKVQQELSTAVHRFRSDLPFIPRFNDEFEDPTLPGLTSKALERGVQVPMILGYNSNEGIFYSDSLGRMDWNDLERNLDKYLHPRILKTLKLRGMTLNDLRQVYFNGECLSENNVDKIVEMCGDLYLRNDVRHLARIQLSNAIVPTYHYRFSFDKNITLYKKLRGSNFKGVNHGEELTYLFKMNVCDTVGMEQLQEHTGAVQVMKRMVEMWTNFAKTGKPIPEKSDLLPIDWKPLAKNSPVDCLDIGEELRMTKTLDTEKLYFGGTCL